jgi:hypothetical protein
MIWGELRLWSDPERESASAPSCMARATMGTFLKVEFSYQSV